MAMAIPKVRQKAFSGPRGSVEHVSGAPARASATLAQTPSFPHSFPFSLEWGRKTAGSRFPTQKVSTGREKGKFDSGMQGASLALEHFSLASLACHPEFPAEIKMASAVQFVNQQHFLE